MITGLMTGGAEKALVRVTGALAGLGIASSVLAFRDGPIRQELQQQGIEVRVVSPVKPWSVLAYASALKRLPETSRPAIIQGWMYHGNIAAFILGRKLGVPVVFGIRQNLSDGKYDKFSTRVAIRMCAGMSRRADASVYNSWSSLRGHVRSGFEQGRSNVIPNGFDLSRYSPNETARRDIRRELQIAESAFVIGHVGRSHAVKNLPMFMRVAAKVLGERSDAHAVIVGQDSGDAKTRLSPVIERTGLRERIHVLGQRNDLERIYCAMDVLCLTSWSESFPNVLGEAMACAVPCIATDVGDVTSIIGTTSTVVPLDDSRAMVDAVFEMLALNRPERAEQGMRCRERVAGEFSIAKTAERYRDLYCSILENDQSRLQAGSGA